MSVKITPSTVEFDPNNAPKKKIVTGIEDAEVGSRQGFGRGLGSRVVEGDDDPLAA